MTRRFVPIHLSFGQIHLLEAIHARETDPEFSWKRVIRPEFVAGALLGLVLGFSISIHHLSSQTNGLAAASRIGLSAYTLSSAPEPAAASNPPNSQIDSRK
jgi:hypothetical protein